MDAEPETIPVYRMPEKDVVAGLLGYPPVRRAYEAGEISYQDVKTMAATMKLADFLVALGGEEGREAALGFMAMVGFEPNRFTENSNALLGPLL